MGVECSVGEEVARAWLRYFGHVMRMNDNRIPKILVLDGFDERKQPNAIRRGRPLKTWLQCVRDDLASRGYGLYSARHLAIKSRDEYRRKIVYSRLS